MSFVSVEPGEGFCDQLVTEIERRLGSEGAGELVAFARRFWADFPLEELDGRTFDDVYGCTQGWWALLQQRDPGRPTVSVFNPSSEVDGWVAPGTVVAIVQRQMPFLIDSLRLALHERKISLHTIHSCAIDVRRDESGRLIASDTPGRTDLQREILIHFEISRRSSSEDRQRIVSELREVLDDIDRVVNDFQAMRARVGEWIEELEKHPPTSLPASEVEEGRAFLTWLLDDHFTFLGLTEVEHCSQGGTIAIREIEGSRLGLLAKRGRRRPVEYLHELNPNLMSTLLEPRLLSFSKSSIRSSVHRRVYSDYVVIRQIDERGEVRGECRIMGLYTSSVYNESPFRIPVVSRKLEGAVERIGSARLSYRGGYLKHVLEGFPREELFQSSEAELYATAHGIMRIQERKRIRLFMRRDPYCRFICCLVYFPRDLFHTELRQKTQRILCETVGASESEFTTYFSESALARTYFVLRVDPRHPPEYDIATIEARIVEACKTWEKKLEEALVSADGEERSAQTLSVYAGAFPSSYKEDFEPRTAIADMKAFERLDEGDAIAMRFFRSAEESGSRLRFKVFHLEEMLALSNVNPILENLGLHVLGEHPYEIGRQGKPRGWIHDFHLEYGFADSIDLAEVSDHFQGAFAAVWHGWAESDLFNRLILGTRLDWREVALLRAYARYMKQIRLHFSLPYIAETLSRHLSIAAELVALFHAYFDPDLDRADGAEKERVAAIGDRIRHALDGVESLDEDRIIRQYVDLIEATLRTNFYQRDARGWPRPYLALKLDPRGIVALPRPRPTCEIFVYSPRVEGVHLRLGKVARGGLRWSDRLEDYRTEVLGLVKAQQVKNAVIVPVGAKGGFVVKEPPLGASREAIRAEGVACYRTFVRGLLDLTDNLVQGEVISPERVVCKDGADSYLVVAADKGTASFSDIANEIAKQYGFWLGDAFASGGSVGYDHKKMGITARGAWVSVRRHFRELGLDVQDEDFTVVGIGDMSGDVFGNGMLLSEHILLVAAFDHRHIFVDPNPDAVASLRERRRLFALPTSSWADYDFALLSPGGGVFSRSAKSIPMTESMRARFGIEQSALTPNELIRALLRAPVDLLWNGGIGTYVKARGESHYAVGDKANDGVRVDAEDLCCRVIGEGGNLGVTQRGRVAFSLRGGAINSDFIDNAAGVDCSDHEVNIKILLNALLAEGELTEKQRRRLLEEMRDSVAELVLAHNERQTQAISLAQAEASRCMGEFRRYITALEVAGHLDRGLEFIPEDDVLAERESQGQTLTRPEIALLVSYTKGILKEALTDSDLADDPCLGRSMEGAFPALLRRRFTEALGRHRLRREIVATQIANDIVDRMGFTFIHRLQGSTGTQVTEIVSAYCTARQVLALDETWVQIEALDESRAMETKIWMVRELRRMARRSTRWLLRNRRGILDPTRDIARFAPTAQELARLLPECLPAELSAEWRERRRRIQQAGGCEALADHLAGAQNLHLIFALVEAAEEASASLRRIAEVYFALGDALELQWLGQRVGELGVENHWQVQARESARDDLDWQQRALSVSVLRRAEPGDDAERAVDRWLAHYGAFVDRWKEMLAELHATPTPDLAICAVALRRLLDWAQSCTSDAAE